MMTTAVSNTQHVRDTKKKVRSGIVSSDKMDKTITVTVSRSKRHQLYDKVINVSKKYTAHDEKNEACMGDLVEITETRPLSKNKRWRLVKILKKKQL